MKPLRRRYRVSALSPVHVGGGRAYARDVDFLVDRDKTYLIDLDRFCDILALSPGAVEQLAAGRADLQRLVEQLRMRPDRLAHRTLPYRLTEHRILLQARDGQGAPVLPGSALKGAWRTLVVWALAFDFDEKARDWVSSEEARRVLDRLLGGATDGPESPGPPFERALLDAPRAHKGRASGFGTDLMRCLRVSDCRLREGDLEIARARVLTAGSDGPGWKSADRRGRPRARPDDPQTDGSAVEAIAPGKGGEVKVTFDGLFELLRTQPEGGRERKLWSAAREELDFDPWRIDIPFQAAVHSRNMGLAVCYRERLFFEERKLYDLARFYVDLEKRIQEAAGTETIFARIGWGSGWEGLTGGVVTGRHRERVRNRYGMGREGFAFPKTRKLALSGTKASRPFGWIRLDPVE